MLILKDKVGKDMEVVKSLAGGLAGATVLTFVHEFFRKNSREAPQIQKLGMHVIRKIAGKKAPKNKKDLYYLAMVSDIVSNTFYYAMSGSSQKPVLSGLLLGTGAGAGVLSIPALTRLEEKYANRSLKTAAMSFGYYTIGGLVSGLVIKLMRK